MAEPLIFKITNQSAWDGSTAVDINRDVFRNINRGVFRDSVGDVLDSVCRVVFRHIILDVDPRTDVGIDEHVGHRAVGPGVRCSIATPGSRITAGQQRQREGQRQDCVSAHHTGPLCRPPSRSV